MSEQEPDRHGIEPDEATRELDAEDNAPQPSMDGMMAEISRLLEGGDGWGGIDTTPGALQRQREESRKRIKDQANIFRDCFATADGHRCLELMIDQTIHAQPYPAEANLPIEAITALVLAHNAQCNFVWAILEAIAQADNRPMKART